MNRPASASPVAVTLPELLRLAQPATTLGLDTLRVRAALQGAAVSRLRGRGMEYDESRPYQPGDDPRSIDWRVTARTGRPHTKLFREERERPVLLWVDLRAPMFFATRGVFKAVQAARAAALLAWAAVQQGDRVGAQVFAEGLHVERRPGRGRSGALAVCNALLSVPAAVPGAVAEPLERLAARLARVVRPGTRVFAISDFHDLDAACVERLAGITRHAELVTLLVHDRLEAELPPPGRYALATARGLAELETAQPELRLAQREAFAARRARLERLAALPGGHALACATDEDVVAVLQRAFARRRGAGAPP